MFISCNLITLRASARPRSFSLSCVAACARARSIIYWRINLLNGQIMLYGKWYSIGGHRHRVYYAGCPQTDRILTGQPVHAACAERSKCPASIKPME